MELRTRFSRPKAVSSPIGSGFSPVYEERVIDGVKTLVKINEDPLNEFVQKSLPDTLIYNILDKYNRGNVDVLNKTIGQFMDVTQFPTSLAEAQNNIIKAQRHFDSLSVDVKRKFDNSPIKFMEAVFDGSVLEKTKDLFPLQSSEGQVPSGSLDTKEDK